MRMYFVILLLFAISLFTLTFYVMWEERHLMVEGESIIKQESINLCEIYANQSLIISKIKSEGTGRQYNLNGTWYNEEKVLEDCKK